MKQKMKSTWMMALLAMILLVGAGCGQQASEPKNTESAPAEEVTLKVASLIPPMTDILDVVKPLLKEDGINLEVVVLSDNIQPNTALANNEVDANFFQHVPFMEQYNEANGSDLVAVKPIYHALFGAYSKKYKSIDELPEGAVIAIPNDSTNVGRSLVMFEQNGMIKLREGAGYAATQADIVENKKNYVFKEVDLLMLARSYDDVDAVAMYPAYASPLGLTPKKDAFITEKTDDRFAITLVARGDNANSEPIQKLAERMTGPEVAKYLEENFGEVSVPAF